MRGSYPWQLPGAPHQGPLFEDVYMGPPRIASVCTRHMNRCPKHCPYRQRVWAASPAVVKPRHMFSGAPVGAPPRGALIALLAGWAYLLMA